VGHPFFESTRPLVFAHRGGAALAPENTLAAFDQGVASGADGLELDVRLSRDGVVVVHHDRTLERTTDLRGAVSSTTADELARADAGHHFMRDGLRPFRGLGLGLPTLASVLARYRDHRLIVEMKQNSPELARAVVGAVRRADAVDRVCLGSFGLRVVRAVRTLDAAVATSAAREEVRWALYRSWCRWPVSRVAYAGYQVPETSGVTRLVSGRFVEHAHRSNLAVQVWTVNAERDARRLLSWGVDGLITDRPDLMVRLVQPEEHPESGPPAG
jgi:glycerophosphoryl diester phosphodiesterase